MRIHLLTGLVLSLALVACGGPSAATRSPAPTVAPPSADQLCELLTPADWAANGLTAARRPTVDSDQPGSAYCVYGGTSGGTGGLELDVFVTASSADAGVTYATIKQSIPDPQLVDVAGAQEAVINPSIDDSFGAILVRSGRLAFTITAPISDNVSIQLTALSALVLARASGLT